MELKENLVICDHEGNFVLWPRGYYDQYVSDTLDIGACPAVRIVTHYDNDDDLLKGNPEKHYGLYQLCPKCDGEGVVSRPPDTPADVRPCSSWKNFYPCPACNGAKLLVRPEMKKEEQP